jgi:ABC-2 type transport system permease protein
VDTRPLTAPPITESAPRGRRVISARTPAWRRIGELLHSRELLVGLVRKELKVKYKNSVLGFVWSMLNPALTLVVFYVVFQIFLKSGIPVFAIYLLSGVLAWNLFSNALPGATQSVVINAPLVKKVAFPREVLALASVGAALVHFFLQSIVLLLALLIFRYPISGHFSLLIVPALLTLLLLVSALGILLSAVNVYLRDTQHLLELLLLAWFWMTPIVYQYRLVADRLKGNSWLMFLNPLTAITVSFQRAIYNKVEAKQAVGPPIHILPSTNSLWWYLERLGIVAAISLVLLYVAMTVFSRLEGNFAEEL